MSYDPKLAALRQTAVIGTLRTSMLRLSTSALRGEADIADPRCGVR